MDASGVQRRAIMVAILLLGLALRLAPWGQNRFLEDEALYADWGLKIATGADPLLDEEPVDKPPLHLYTLALSFTLFASPPRPGEAEGGLETAARLPSLFASVIGIALVYALARSLPMRRGREEAALLAALLLALSPFDILFASTAFTDPLMVAWVLAALLAASRGRLGAAGLLIGLAAATKQQGLLFLPLVTLLGWARLPMSDRHRKSWGRWLRFALGFGLAAVGVLWWDGARAQEPGFWAQGIISYGGLGPAQPEALGERAVEWLKLVGGFWGTPGFWLLLLIGILVNWGLRDRKIGNWELGIGHWELVDWVLAGFIVGFLLLHWLVGFQVWDRYLLGLVPLTAILAARLLVRLGAAIRAPRWRQTYALGLTALLVLLLTGPVLQAARSELPYGGDHGAYDGIDDLAAYLRQHAPPGAVLYHYWLGYHYRFYLRGVPLRLHWYPDPDDLARDAVIYRREPRYIAFPSFRDGSAAEAALRAAGIELEPVFEARRRDGTVSFRLYRLVNW
ncbi:MAG TPA: hypothetical protein ENJ31_08785 [Anaerolineae bacterium]|nr:hypothetical protein [Anaerolineae bacterium]